MKETGDDKLHDDDSYRVAIIINIHGNHESMNSTKPRNFRFT